VTTTTATPHPWNTGFQWQDHAGPFTTITAEQAAAFDRDGFFVIEDVLTADEVRRTLDEIDPVEAKVDAFLQQQQDGRAAIAETGAITFTTHLVKRSEWLRGLAAHPKLAGIATDLLGPDVRLYWDQAVYKKPEKPRRFPWHQDNGYTFIEPQQYLTIWLALSDATEENGCPQVAKGLHRLGTLTHRYVEPLGFECFERPDEVAVAPVKAGGAVVFSSLTPHLTGPNTTDAVRKAYILQYAPDGAAIQVGDPTAGPPTSTTTCDDPDRQFLIARGGKPV
jgi:ectoine hydroxylase-related dioxygenase (phytanoyl-CoA dioxygenase family)